MNTYPKDWPRCPICGDFALDGHITCGRFECNEHEVRRNRADDEATSRALDIVERDF